MLARLTQVACFSLFLGLAGCGGGTDVSVGPTNDGGGGSGSSLKPEPAGVYLGTAGTSINRQLLAVNLPTSAPTYSYFWLYSAANGTVASQVDGFLSGQFGAANGSLSSISTVGHDFTGASGSFSLNGGSYQTGHLFVDLTLAGDGDSAIDLVRQTPDALLLSQLSGTTFTGTARSISGSATANVSLEINAGGAMSGTDNSGCQFSGTLSSSAVQGVLKAIVHPSAGNADSGNCMGDRSLQFSGVALMYQQQFFLVVAPAGGGDAAIFVGQ